MGSKVEPAPFRIAIVGGGIGGLFCALCIHHHCKSVGARFAIDVFEQASQYKEIGAGVGIGVNAARLVHKLGIGERLNAICGNRSGVWIAFKKFNDSSEVLTLLTDDDQTVRQAPCARTEFLDLLREFVEERHAATLHTKKACERVEDNGDSVTIHFADQTTAEADIVIACDGIHSTVRKQFTLDRPIYTGKIAYRGVVPTASLTSWPFRTYAVMWVAKGRHFLVFPISCNKDLNIVAFVTKGEEEVADVKESWTSICERRDVEEDFAGFDKCVQDIIQLMPENPSRWRINDRRPLDLWHYMDGKVILAGDAAHAPTPHLGAGAGQSMESAWVLGRAVSEYLSPDAKSTRNPHFESLATTAQFYQSVRLPRAQRTQVTSRKAGDTYELQAEGMEGMSFDESCAFLAEKTRERMKWVWEEDLDAAYEKLRDPAVVAVSTGDT